MDFWQPYHLSQITNTLRCKAFYIEVLFRWKRRGIKWKERTSSKFLLLVAAMTATMTACCNSWTGSSSLVCQLQERWHLSKEAASDDAATKKKRSMERYILVMSRMKPSYLDEPSGSIRVVTGWLTISQYTERINFCYHFNAVIQTDCRCHIWVWCMF